MSSIFTYNPSPPKPASPWADNTPTHLTPSTTPKLSPLAPDSITGDTPGHLKTNNNSGKVRNHFLGDGERDGVLTASGERVTDLVAEPQMGAIEYKLSLVRGGKSEARLDQLVTQLLWRLQQSSPFHANSFVSKSSDAISSLVQESQGALYEVGVADDGRLVGLCEEELRASLDTLRIMASRLGCSVTIVRKESVGTVSPGDVTRAEGKQADLFKARQRSRARSDRGDNDTGEAGHPGSEGILGIPKVGDPLWVVEALVKADHGKAPTPQGLALQHIPTQPDTKGGTEQLRITLTGATTCGKTTLLGTLSTGELDNGRGKSRISLLRHRHELASGITSSVTWEILGYMPPNAKTEITQPPPLVGCGRSSRLINYASGNISSWNDIHAAADGGRVVFLSDSAGNPKFSRTTFKSLIGWAPHYAAFLVAANDDESISADENSGGPLGLSKPSQAHLDLCLKLGLRMLVVFTKRDLGTKARLKRVFGSLLTVLKQHGRKPAILSAIRDLDGVIGALKADQEHVVPIVFTSSVNGQGVDLLHELMLRLPAPQPPTPPRPTLEEGATEAIAGDSGMLSTLFHIEDIYGFPPAHSAEDGEGGAVVGGHVKYGKISIGDELLVGPFPPVDSASSSPPSIDGTPVATGYNQPFSPSAGHPPGLLSKSHDSSSERKGNPPKTGQSTTDHADDTETESIASTHEEWGWKPVKVISVRRLRLPVTTLFAGEAGTLGVALTQQEPHVESSIPLSPANLQFRLGVLEVDDKEDGGLRIRQSENSRPRNTSNTFSSTHGSRVLAPASSPTITPSLLSTRLRKGMVIFNCPPPTIPAPWTKAYRHFTTVLDGEANPLAPGGSVVVYIASVRAVARIVSVDLPRVKHEDIFCLDDDNNREAEHPSQSADGGGAQMGQGEGEEAGRRRYTLEFDHGRAEWIEMGDRVLIVPGGGKRGLDAFVGRVVEGLT